MDAFDDFKNIWQTQEARNLPDAAAMEALARKYRQTRKRNVVLLLMVAVLLVPIFSVMFYLTAQKTFSVVFGEVLMMCGAIITVIIKLKNLRETNSDEHLPTTVFLNKMQEKLHQRPTANLLQIFATVCFAAGYASYIFDQVKDNNVVLIAALSGIMLYCGLVYFLLRPFSRKKSRKKIKKILQKISAVEGDF